MALVKSLVYFFMLPGAFSVEQYWPDDNFHRKAYDLSTLQK